MTAVKKAPILAGPPSNPTSAKVGTETWTVKANVAMIANVIIAARSRGARQT